MNPNPCSCEKARPHPSPLPRGEGEPSGGSRRDHRLVNVFCFDKTLLRANAIRETWSGVRTQLNRSGPGGERLLPSVSHRTVSVQKQSARLPPPPRGKGVRVGTSTAWIRMNPALLLALASFTISSGKRT